MFTLIKALCIDNRWVKKLHRAHRKSCLQLHIYSEPALVWFGPGNRLIDSRLNVVKEWKSHNMDKIWRKEICDPRIWLSSNWPCPASPSSSRQERRNGVDVSHRRGLVSVPWPHPPPHPAYQQSSYELIWSPMSSIIAKHSLAWPLWFSLWKGAKVMLEIEEAEDLVWTRNKIRPPAVLSKDTHQHLFAIPICSKLHPSQTASCGDMSLNLEIICCVPYLICIIIDHS